MHMHVPHGFLPFPSLVCPVISSVFPLHKFSVSFSLPCVVMRCVCSFVLLHWAFFSPSNSIVLRRGECNGLPSPGFCPVVLSCLCALLLLCAPFLPPLLSLLDVPSYLKQSVFTSKARTQYWKFVVVLNTSRTHILVLSYSFHAFARDPTVATKRQEW